MIAARAGGRRQGSVRPGAVVAVLLLAAVAGVAGGYGISRLRTSSAPAASPAVVTMRYGMHGQAAWAAGTQPAPPVTLPDQTGHAVSLAALRGRPVVMAFLDSHCTAACPLEGRALAAAEAALPAAQRPVLVVVSVNPLDTPASTRAAIRKWGLGLTAWHWLRGTHAGLAPVWRAYRIFVAPPANGDITHTEAIYLIDRRGYERSAYLYPFLPAPVRSDLRTLATQGSA